MRIAELLLREARDPRVTGVTLTRVELSGDFSHAKVWFRPLPGGPEGAEIEAGLRSVGGFLRREIGRSMRLRTVPELHFALDPLPEQGQRIEDLLAQVHGIAPAGPPAGDEDE